MTTGSKVVLGLLAAVGLGGGIALIAAARKGSGGGGGGGGGGGTTPGVTVTGQAYFNSLPAATQQQVLAAMYQWYQARKDPSNPTWPSSIVQDPNLTSVSDLTSDTTGWNFQAVITAYQYMAGGLTQSGALDANTEASLLADYTPSS